MASNDGGKIRHQVAPFSKPWKSNDRSSFLKSKNCTFDFEMSYPAAKSEIHRFPPQQPCSVETGQIASSISALPLTPTSPLRQARDVLFHPARGRRDLQQGGGKFSSFHANKKSFRASDAAHREIRNPGNLINGRKPWIPARAPFHGAWPG